jgi:hypothetical protein
MIKFLIAITIFLTAITLGCQKPTLQGRYVCDQSLVKGDTTIRDSNSVKVYLDFTCSIKEMVFSGEKTVRLDMRENQYTTTYFIDDSVVHIAGTGGEVTVTIRDENTLVGTGVTQGIFLKQ